MLGPGWVLLALLLRQASAGTLPTQEIDVSSTLQLPQRICRCRCRRRRCHHRRRRHCHCPSQHLQFLQVESLIGTIDLICNIYEHSPPTAGGRPGATALAAQGIADRLTSMLHHFHTRGAPPPCLCCTTSWSKNKIPNPYPPELIETYTRQTALFLSSSNATRVMERAPHIVPSELEPEVRMRARAAFSSIVCGLRRRI